LQAWSAHSDKPSWHAKGDDATKLLADALAKRLGDD